MKSPVKNKKTYKIDMQPIGRRVDINPGQTVLDAAQLSGIGLVSICGGAGQCNSCVVKIVKGDVNQITENESTCLTDDEISANFRLACQVIPLSDLVIDIPSDSLTTPQRLQVEGIELQVQLDPAVSFLDLKIPPPSLEDLRSDTNRLLDELSAAGFDAIDINFPILSDLSNILRENEWNVRVTVRDSEVIAILPYQSEIFGLAVDIGTTKVAVYLLSLESGEVIDKLGEMNPQIAYGEDVISRIAYTNDNKNGRQNMSEMVVETINSQIIEMCKKAKITPAQIVDAVVVGNTAMHHLFAGLPVKQLAYSPYIPSISQHLDFHANRIDLNISKSAYVHLLPNIAGYVGADHAAVLLANKLWETNKTVFAVDIGTNTEITLASKGRLLSCSCASGPAFEGAHIQDGMRAAPGAIERIQIENADEIRLFTIGDQSPVGICGSGIIDAVAELMSIQAINNKGAFVKDHSRVRKNKNNNQEYLLVDAENTGHNKDITINRSDINEVQLAKGAIRAGLEILLDEAGITAEDVDEIIIAGAFGTYINVKNAIKIGMFPNLPLERFKQVGNAAGMGARLALLSQKQRKIIQNVVKKIEYIELTTAPNFLKIFIKAMIFEK